MTKLWQNIFFTILFQVNHHHHQQHHHDLEVEPKREMINKRKRVKYEKMKGILRHVFKEKKI